jgi:uncharacterized protein YndB with AHSA1/START domain
MVEVEPRATCASTIEAGEVPISGYENSLTSAPPDPDVSDRPFTLTVEREFEVPAHSIYLAWTERMDSWFAAPGTLLMRPEIGAAFFFETVFMAPGASRPKRYPHYGRFLRLLPDRLIELTWVTGAGGTEGAETIVTVELEPRAGRSHLRLTHAGFAGRAARDQHLAAWPAVLNHLAAQLQGPAAQDKTQ